MSVEDTVLTISATIMSNIMSAFGIVLYFKHRLDRADKCLTRIEERLDKRIDGIEDRFHQHGGERD